MEWFIGEVSNAIQKAISENKVFIVFVKDDGDDSKKMEDLWNDQEIAEVCSVEKCVAINISAASVPGQQFGAIYPILCVPSTYLINNQGTPTDIIPGALPKEEFTKRLKDAVDNTLALISTTSVAEDTLTTTENEPLSEQPSSSSSATVQEAENESNLGTVKESSENTAQGSAEVFNDDLEAELTTQEKSMIEMLREKAKLKREKEEKQKLKEMEKKRRETGQELAIAQRQMAERQAVQLAKEIADRKAEEKAARDKVREQIRLDKIEKAKRFSSEKKEREDAVRKKNEAAASQAAALAEKKRVDNSTTARLQFRLPDGSSVSNQFNADAKFLCAEVFVKEHVQLPNIRLTTVYPKHEFNSEDALKSFRELGLVPNASIIVSPGRSTNTSKSPSTSSLNPLSFIMFVFAPIIAIFNWILSFFTGNTNNENQSNQSTSSTSYQPQNNPRDESVRRRNLPTDSPRGNIQRLRRDDDDDNATWNGNSTQQM